MLCYGIYNLILIFIWKNKHARIARKTEKLGKLGKKNYERLGLSGIETYSKAPIIKAV